MAGVHGWIVKIVVGILYTVTVMGQGSTNLIQWRYRPGPPMGAVCIMLFVTQSVAN